MRILLLANTDWYIFNFRRSLVAELRKQGHHVVVATPEGAYSSALSSIASRWVQAPILRRNVNSFREVRFFRWLVSLLKAERIELVHAFTLKCVVHASIAAKLMRIPARIFAVAGLGSIFTGRDGLAKALRVGLIVALRFSLRGSRTRIIFQNPSDLAVFQQYRVGDVGAFRLIPGSGVDLARFHPRRSHRKKANSVLLASRLIWEKGIGEFVQAARAVRARHPHVEFLLAGAPDPGNPWSVPDAALEDWVKAGVVKWLGHVADMVALLEQVDIVVLPSYYGEGLPKTLLEAAACALPIITTDVPGCRDVVSHQLHGLLVPPRDASALAASIELLLDNCELRSRLGRAARVKAENQFDERIVIRDTLVVYHELAEAIQGVN